MDDYDGLTMDQLIKSLHNTLVRKNYERTEIKLQARKYAMNGDKERAISELKQYNAKTIKYEQLVKVYTKACIFRDNANDTHDLAQISTSMRYAVDTHPIQDIQLEWENTVQMDIGELPSIESKEYDELLDEEMEIMMPDVPTHTPIIKETKTRIYAT